MFFKEKEIEACGKPICTWQECDGSCKATEPEQLIQLLQKQAHEQEKKVVTSIDIFNKEDSLLRELLHCLAKPCSHAAMIQYCDYFESCEDCRVSWAMSMIGGKRNEKV